MTYNRITILTISILLGVSCVICAPFNIHQQMTIDELKSTFHVDNHNLVPEYEIISITHNRYNDGKRNGKSQKLKASKEGISYIKELKFKAFGKELNLTLALTKGLFNKNTLKTWRVMEPNSKSQDVKSLKFIKEPQTMEEDIGELYQDVEHQAALLLRNHKDTLIIVRYGLRQGSIGSDLVIRPIPERLLPDSLSKNRKGLDSDILRTTNVVGADLQLHQSHIIYKQNKDKTKYTPINDYAFVNPDVYKYNDKLRSTFQASNATYNVYPEIMVLVDYDIANLYNYNDLDILRYVLTFWNAVDLRYRAIGNVYLRIVGFHFAIQSDCFFFMNTYNYNKNLVEVSKATENMTKYAYYLYFNRSQHFDIAITMTRRDLCLEINPFHCDKNVDGYAHEIGGACRINYFAKQMKAVGLVEDSGGYSGIIVAAHEIAHLLGVVHDNTPAVTDLPNSPGATKCSDLDGYLMSNYRGSSANQFQWSQCSIECFKYFFGHTDSSCLFNDPSYYDLSQTNLPGEQISLNLQCRLRLNNPDAYYCNKDYSSVCIQLQCTPDNFNPSFNCLNFGPAAEGSYCGNEKHCINGNCVWKF